MKKLLAIAVLTLVASTASAVEIATNLYTNHVFEDTYKDKKTGERVKFNEDNKMYTAWFAIEQSEFEKPFPDGTEVKYGFGVFTDSFYETGPIAGFVIEPRIDQYIIKGFGSFETYWGMGAVMTTTYEDMSFMPILIAHVGVRTQSLFANVGAYGMGAAITGNVGVRF